MRIGKRVDKLILPHFLRTALRIGSIVILGSLFILLFWMNITPGHFQYGSCKCSVGYYKNEEVNHNAPICSVVGECLASSFDSAKVVLSSIDLYK